MSYLRDSSAIFTRLSIWLAHRKGLQLLIVHFSTTFLYRLWTDLAWELKLEVLSASFLIFSFILWRFVSVFWDSNFLEF